MKDFWNDYVGLCKVSSQFYKKHWKGVILLNVALIGAEYAYFRHQSKKFEKCLSKNQENGTQ